MIASSLIRNYFLEAIFNIETVSNLFISIFKTQQLHNYVALVPFKKLWVHMAPSLPGSSYYVDIEGDSLSIG